MSVAFIKQHKRVMINRFGQSDDVKGLTQVLTTLAPLVFLWWVAVSSAASSWWITVCVVPLIILFNLRVFALMHECGHLSLFRSAKLNRAVGFLFGVIAGMPQYVWSQHHAYHHANNGNWEKYRGPYATLSVDEYAALTKGKQRFYRYKCSIYASPIAGFIYLIVMPRLNWIRGELGLLRHTVRNKFARPDLSLRAHAATFRCPYWKTPREHRHMLWNNVVLLGSWAFMAWLCGPLLFFSIYFVVVSFAGALGIVLFTVQHNFEHAYASSTDRWDHDTGAIEGTSFLSLPQWMNWFTANIGYHHIHHLSANIPNYRLVKCHDEYAHLFPDVVRLKLSQVNHSLKCILWDVRARRIISVAEYRRGA